MPILPHGAYTFVEVLVALSLLSFAGLAVLKLQHESLQFSQSAHFRLIAHQELINFVEASYPDYDKPRLEAIISAWNKKNSAYLPQAQASIQLDKNSLILKLTWQSKKEEFITLNV